MTILIFNLSGGFTDMKKNLLAITLFTKEHNYKFTIKNCTARPQSLDLNTSKIDEEIIKNGYMYDFKNLFDEKTFLIYDNYISFETIDSCDQNTFNFNDTYKPSLIFKDRTHLTNYKNIIKEIDTPYVYMGNHFYFYSGYNITSILFSKDFNATIIPSSKIWTEYNNFISTIDFQYNFIHFRYENDMKKMLSILKNINSLDYTLSDVIKLNAFENNLKIYVATTNIEEFYDKKLIEKPLDTYNIFYNTKKCVFFDENAFIDFLIGMNSVEVLGFSHSGFSVCLTKLKNKNKYYNL